MNTNILPCFLAHLHILCILYPWKEQVLSATGNQIKEESLREIKKRKEEWLLIQDPAYFSISDPRWKVTNYPNPAHHLPQEEGERESIPLIIVV